MKSERVQYNTLCLQNVANTWQKNGYAVLLHSSDKFLENGAAEESYLRRSMDLFKGPIDSSLEASVPSQGYSARQSALGRRRTASLSTAPAT